MASELYSGLRALGASSGLGCCCILGQDILFTQCLSPLKCINGGSPAIE